MNSSGHVPPKSRLCLIGFLVLNIAAFTVMTFLSLGSASLVVSWSKSHLESLLILYLALLLTLIIGNLVNSKLKAVLVFWNWREPWPVNRAFTRYLQKEPPARPGATDPDAGRKSIDPQAQKTLWGQIYGKYRNEPAIMEAATQFRLTQELTWLAFVILVFFGMGTLAIGHITAQTIAYAACLLIQYICASMVARTAGTRFFCDVLAVGQIHKIIERKEHNGDFASL